MRKYFLILLALLTVSSCEYIKSFRQGEVKVAKIGSNVLYESDVTSLMPEGVSAEDSATMVRQYIDTWALSKLLLLKAEENLSKSEKDITVEVEEFRQALLGYRYEKSYIEERIDTVVTVQEERQYFDEHINSYIASGSIVKARVIKIPKSSPYYEIIKASYQVVDESAIEELEDLCYSSAERYTDFDKKWVSIDVLARELGQDVFSCERDINTSNSIEKSIDGSNYLIFILEKVAPGEVSPFEYNSVKIKDAIISKRKQDVLTTLERDLLNDAVNNKILKIYTKKDE